MSKIIPFQTHLRPALPTIVGNVDYQRFEEQLKRMDEILRLSGAEALFVKLSLEQWEAQASTGPPNDGQRWKHQEHSSRALRCIVLQGILGEGFRGMSRRLAECPLFQWFCGLDQLDVVRVPAKTTLHRYTHWLEAEQLERVVAGLLAAAAQEAPEGKSQALGLAQSIELDTVWLDATCVKANIHYPVDWVLLRDATRTLMKATMLIRTHGLQHRMEDPAKFVSRMNRLCMEMTQSRRGRVDSNRQRKRVLRQMKKLLRTIRLHALRHRDLLEAQWQQTDWSLGHVQDVLGKIDQVLLQLPAAIKQAHERIIGQRPVKNEDKILSLYEPDVHVIVRGKAGVEVEFGNTLLLAEQAQGLLLDWQFYQERAPSDSSQLPESLERMERRYGPGEIKAMGGDRAFDSKGNRALLAERKIFNGLCPRNVQELKRRQHSGRFQRIQRRRAQTEGRIGIYKNDFLGRPLRSKGYENRKLAVVWGVLEHNLWVLSRLETADVKARKKAA